jgi:hypothetical protein
VKSTAQALILLWAADGGFNVLEVDYGVAFGLAGGAAVLSLLTSVASSAIGDTSSPSLVSENDGRLTAD